MTARLRPAAAAGLRGRRSAPERRNPAVLRGRDIPPAWPRMVEDVVAIEGAERSQLFGESLPIGLRLAGG